MCVMGVCFKQLPPVSEDKYAFLLQKESKDELAMLSCLYPLMFTHLDAAHSSSLVCTDASSRYIGAAEAPVSQSLHRELWRVRERKGWATHLVGRAAEYVMACAPEK